MAQCSSKHLLLDRVEQRLRAVRPKYGLPTRKAHKAKGRRKGRWCVWSKLWRLVDGVEIRFSDSRPRCEPLAIPSSKYESSKLYHYRQCWMTINRNAMDGKGEEMFQPASLPAGYTTL